MGFVPRHMGCAASWRREGNSETAGDFSRGWGVVIWAEGSTSRRPMPGFSGLRVDNRVIIIKDDPSVSFRSVSVRSCLRRWPLRNEENDVMHIQVCVKPLPGPRKGVLMGIP